ncbi:MAG TPA: DALR anticodon-binding domain-containing protein [Streptosporangiaceae bacterium]|nr:DALR anticodon-binding domain-containing protein [Streptosporangiaceae bacterium]
MIIGDLSAALATAAAAAVASGGLTGDGGLGADPGLAVGTWRPVPSEVGGGPGSYATTLPFVLAHRLAADPARVAAVLAAALRSIRAGAEISDISVTGGGYLSLTITPDTLARLAARISQAGPGCAGSQAMDGVRVSAPRDARLASARDWADAWPRLTSEQGGRLAQAAGAEVTWVPLLPEKNAPGEGGPVAEAVAYAGEDAVRFALSRLAGGPASRLPRAHEPGLAPRAMAAQHLGNPAYAVRYAHAHAASALRQAADLGLPELDVERFQPRLLAHPSERVLLDAMSWLPERVAGAARRRQPHVVAAYLEDLASRYLDWQEACPVMRPGSVPPRPDPRPAGRLPAGGELIQARLQLASGARTVLGTGLRLLGIAAPSRM